MFTGIVETTGTVQSIVFREGGARIVVQVGTMAHELTLGESVAVNGCCLTVTEFDGGGHGGIRPSDRDAEGHEHGAVARGVAGEPGTGPAHRRPLERALRAGACGRDCRGPGTAAGGQ